MCRLRHSHTPHLERLERAERQMREEDERKMPKWVGTTPWYGYWTSVTDYSYEGDK
jgi:hypothetical protein